ncbi:Hypothetical Protein FCC1311_053242 [Hondaea fermentalgiana]|uniref:Transmembrane protein n=1 Tax=Hondaea fermentalgiana TaxID=2315210 RepID=A0A2R5GLE7_9STRA|nr:Hypothetical Protein FCC1311_053242 [Hondaea fermentalgiana]|eukprot:GBG29101.1 Hypothetical Protein FCC1311_053242 [Hondaea fermentalgiana]
MSWPWQGDSRVQAVASEDEDFAASFVGNNGQRARRMLQGGATGTAGADASDDNSEGFRNLEAAPPAPPRPGAAMRSDDGDGNHARNLALDDGNDDVTLEEGGRHLVKAMSNWFIPRDGPPPSAAGESPGPVGAFFRDRIASVGSFSHDVDDEEGSWNPVFPASLSPPVGRPGVGPFAPRIRSGPNGADSSFQSRADSIKVDITFSTAEMNLKRDLKRHYLALAIGCWIFLTVVQSVSLICLNYWEYSPVVIALLIMAGSVVFYWRYVWGVLRLPFKRLWETPYPYSAAAAVLGSLAQHAMFLIYEGYELGQLLIVFFMIQAFYVILVASTFRHYMSKWQRFLNHRKLCFDSLQTGLAKAEHRQKLLHEHD